jgi:Type ISP C-terminal specificity domain
MRGFIFTKTSSPFMTTPCARKPALITDPAVGTGTFLLGVLRQIVETVEADEGSGSVPAAIKAAVQRLVGFEMQLGPFAVAQLRILAELTDLIGTAPPPPRMFVTDTLGNPYEKDDYIPSLLGAIAKSRKEANKIKQSEVITVVLGNPPYKEKAKGLGGWVESSTENSPEAAPLSAWIPPADWGVSAHAKHLRNLYIYFWRWATWKVFDLDPNANTGIVCFITVAGFLNGPGFERMRAYLRRTTDEIWVMDCSPEGHQPEVNTRIFEGVQQPICIVLASRPKGTKPETPATVRFRALPAGHRQTKFEALKSLTLEADGWIECSTAWRAPFLPAATGAWATFPALTDLFIYNGSGTQPKRMWVIAPDAESLRMRWQALIVAPEDEKEELFHATLRDGKPADRHIRSVVKESLPGYEPELTRLVDEKGTCRPPVRFAFRSFNRQWIIPDLRVITQPNSQLWEWYSEQQTYLTFGDRSPTNGPAITFTGLIPDLNYYNGRGGRVLPLWHDREASAPNIPPNLLTYLAQRYQRAVSAEDLFAYLAAIAAHPAFTSRFQADLVQPGLRIPLTAEADTFAAAIKLGSTVIWLHTFGERFADAKQGRPLAPPRLPAEVAPRIPKNGAIPQDALAMPDSIEYDETNQRLMIGKGYVERVTAHMWRYEVSGKQVLRQWFSYRKANRERPIIGDRRPPSKLGEIQPDHWLPEYTTELINVLNVLGRLIDLEPAQADLLERVCSGATIAYDELCAASAFEIPASFSRSTKRKVVDEQKRFFD